MMTTSNFQTSANSVRPTMAMALRALAMAALVVTAAACGGGPRFPGLTADEIFNLGLQAYNDENWTEAREAFEQALLTPNFARAPEARIYIARSYFNQEQFILARSEFQRALDRYPTDTIAAHASLGVCEAYAGASPIVERDQTPTQNALQSCSNVARDYAGTVMGLRAAEIQLEMEDKLAQKDYVIGEHYFKRGLFDSALIYFEDVLEQHPDSQWAPWAMYQIILAFERIGYTIDAQEYRDRLQRTYPDSEPAQMLSGNTDGG